MGWIDFWSALELGLKGGGTCVEAPQLPQQDTYTYL